MRTINLFLFSSLLTAIGNSPAAADSATRHPGPLHVDFTHCTEFAGVAPIDELKAAALTPSPYALDLSGGQASLVVRVSDCESISVNGSPGHAGRVAHIGIELISPDGTGTDPYTSINNYTLTFSSNLSALAEGLQAFGIPAQVTPNLEYEFAPKKGPSQLFAAVAPEAEIWPTWFLHGTVTNPSLPSPFLANWWYQSELGQVKMATTFPVIYFDFTSQVAFYTNANNFIGQLIGGDAIPNFPVSYRGQYAHASMTVTLHP